jgi:hypothetical protein
MPDSRVVIWQRQFEQELREIFHDPGEADEFVASAELLLAHVPEIGMPESEGSSVWILPMAPVRNRQLTLFYAFDATRVWLLSIRAI